MEHARECPAKLQYCSSFDPKTRVFFNVSGEVLGLFKDKSFLSSDKLTQTQKACFFFFPSLKSKH